MNCNDPIARELILDRLLGSVRLLTSLEKRLLYVVHIISFGGQM
jgi:hypothetical protein